MSHKITDFVWAEQRTNFNGIEFRSLHKFVLLAYTTYAHDDGTHIFPAMSTIARVTRLSERTVQRLTHDLVKMGLLVSDGVGPRRTNQWHIPISSEGDRLSILAGYHGDFYGILLGDNDAKSLGDNLTPESLTLIDIDTVKEEYLSLLKNAVQSCGMEQQTARDFILTLEQPKVIFIRPNGILHIAGLGSEAQIYQANYARTLERALAGALPEEVKIVFEE